MYQVYCAHFRLKRGKSCKYIGWARCQEWRILWAKKKPPAWMKAMDPDTLWYETLEDEIPSREAARALEAMHAARLVLKDVSANRGGPWLRPTLFSGWQELARRVAACRSLLSLSALAAEVPGGRLDKHMQGARFEADPDAGPATARADRAVVVKIRSGSRGCMGSDTRKRQLAMNEYKHGTSKHRKLTRGVDVSARIRRSNERRQTPRASGARRS